MQKARKAPLSAPRCRGYPSLPQGKEPGPTRLASE